MFLNFPAIFGVTKKDDVRIRAKRAMSLPDADGNSVHVDPGDEITVSAKTSKELDWQDCSIISEPSNREPIANPVPARPEPSPAPENWKGLPSCFSEYFDINEMFRVARLHIEMVRQCRIDIWGGTVSPFAMADVKTLIALNFAQPNPRSNVIYQQRIIDLDSPEARELENYLVAAETESEDYLKRLRETYGLKLQKLYLECGMKYLSVCEQSIELIRELADIGFQIFKTRVAALGLADFQVWKLFGGSADFLRFANIQEHHPDGRCSAGYGPDGVLREFCDLPVQSSANHFQRETARLADLTPLLAQARKELATAQRVSKAAA